MQSRHPISLSFAVGAVVLLAAGCGGGNGASPGIASVASPGTVATTTTTTGPTTQSGSGSPGTSRAAGGQDGGQFQIGMNVGTVDGPKFSACMRKHGITNFPDPNGQGVITIHSGMGIDPNSPAYDAAQTACEKVLPNGGQPTPAQIARSQQQLLAYSTCMRAHGIKDFPDPTNGGLRVRSRPGSDLDPNNPTFRKAQQACQRLMPVKGGG